MMFQHLSIVWIAVIDLWLGLQHVTLYACSPHVHAGFLHPKKMPLGVLKALDVNEWVKMCVHAISTLHSQFIPRVPGISSRSTTIQTCGYWMLMRMRIKDLLKLQSQNWGCEAIPFTSLVIYFLHLCDLFIFRNS